VHLVELINSRPIPAAGVFAALTRRCPLRCRHCSTSSTMASEQHDDRMFLRFAESFSAACHPRYLLLTGGEPLIRPRLTARLAEAARAVGTRTYALTGMYFARGGGDIPAPVRQALRSVDHVAASIDAFHEEEVSRRDVFRVVHRLLDVGTDVSFQVVGTGDDDPYLAEVTSAIRREFGDRVPMLVGAVRPHGRAKSLPLHREDNRQDHGEAHTARRTGRHAHEPLPCTIAAWPVVGPDGTVTACGNQAVVDHVPLPEHLRLGHVTVDDWPAIRARCLGAPLVRALRLVGPRSLHRRYGSTEPGSSYCQTCWRLGDDATALAAAEVLAARATTTIVEAYAEALQRERGAVGFARRYGCAAYAELVLLGHDEPKAAACSA